MNCSHCTSLSTKEQRKKTILGYRTFRCLTCKHVLNERSGTAFNSLEYPTDIVLLVVVLATWSICSQNRRFAPVQPLSPSHIALIKRCTWQDN
jgi:hypothetical protein